MTPAVPPSTPVAPADFLGVSTDTWNAVGSMATALGVLIAAAAAVVAVRQLREGRLARLDQNRPYVMVTLERSRTAFSSMDLCVRNIGAGPARDVRIVVDPPLQRAKDDPGQRPFTEARILNEPFPVMPPGYELVTWFDSAVDRMEAEEDLPDRYEITVSYHDGHGHSWTETTVEDMGLMNDLYFAEEYTLHDAAKAIREIRDVIKKSPLLKGEVQAVVEDREVRRERVTRERDQMRARREETMRRIEEAQARAAQTESEEAKGDTTPDVR